MATSVPLLFQNVWNAIVSAWNFTRNWFVSHHIPAVLMIAWLAIRFAVGAVSELFNLIYTTALQTQSLVVDKAESGAGSGISALTYFGVVNSFFPVPETFAFLAAIFAVRSTLWAYVFLRALYKSIPLKAS